MPIRHHQDYNARLAEHAAGEPLYGWRRVEPPLYFEDTVFNGRKTTAERTLIALKLRYALVVALSIPVERLQKLRLTVVNSLHDVVVAMVHFRPKLFGVLFNLSAKLFDVPLQLGPEVSDVAFAGGSVSVVHKSLLSK
jgi:hypothetical protein